MNREQAKELLPAITHFANGGDLWYCENIIKSSVMTWHKQSEVWVGKTGCHINNIIEDKHFEARKAEALGEEVEVQMPNNSWYIDDSPSWYSDATYRPKKPVYAWQWINIVNGKIAGITAELLEKEPYPGWIKFEPSKRVRK